jgi:hypothetical protein
VSNDVLTPLKVSGGIKGIRDGSSSIEVLLTGRKSLIAGVLGHDGSEEHGNISKSGVHEPGGDVGLPGRSRAVYGVNNLLVDGYRYETGGKRVRKDSTGT